MQAQTYALMTFVHDSHKPEPPTTKSLAGVPQLKLVQLTKQDDIKDYLVTLEWIMHTYKIPRALWTYYLAPQLTRKASIIWSILFRV